MKKLEKKNRPDSLKWLEQLINMCGGLVDYRAQFSLKMQSLILTDVNNLIATIVSQFQQIRPFSALFQN